MSDLLPHHQLLPVLHCILQIHGLHFPTPTLSGLAFSQSARLDLDINTVN